MVTQEEQQFLEQMQADIDAAQANRGSSNNIPYSAAMFGGQNKQNLVEWQLDFRPELEDIEHLLRSDVLIRDSQGNEFWKTNPDQGCILFNDLGVSDLLREIRMFLNKNKVLSYYRIEEIKPRIKMFGHELRGLIYNNAERYGMDNDYKVNNFAIIVLTILSMVEDAYRRAINGEERKGLGEARVVTQTDPIMSPQNYGMYGSMQGGQQKKGFLSKVMPWNWNSR